MNESIIGGWVLAFLGGMTVVVVAIVTLVRSLAASRFVWDGSQTTWAIVGGVAFVIGVVLFVSSIFRETRR